MYSNQQNISIRIFSSHSIPFVNIIPSSGVYAVYGDSVKLFETDKISFITVSLAEDSVIIQKTGFRGKFRAVRFVPSVTASSFKIKPLQSTYNARIYDDELYISAQYKTLRIINRVDIEKYTAGVVLWEVGAKNPPEFNKVKAITCRTYALGNWRRHEFEGFQLCDEVHCQVFKGKTFSADIHNATLETSGYVLVDDSAEIITASFFSNCGGQTMNSEDVWSKAVSCLRSIQDTFCLNKTNAVWEKKIPKDLWLDYIKAKYNFPTNDSFLVKKVLNFDQPFRKTYLVNAGFNIPLKSVREDMKLKSTYFNIKEKEDMIIFSGKGFGHGVGLCQEGAMRMSEIGYSYIKILGYYYANVHLIRFSQIDFFKTE